MAVKEFRDPAEPQWEQLVNELKSGKQLEASAITAEKLAAEAVTTAKLATSAVTEAKIANGAVAPGKLVGPGLPASPGTESLTAEIGTAGGVVMSIARYTAKAEASAKVKVKHGLNTEFVQVTAYSTTTKLPTEVLDFGAELKGALAKVKIISAEEIELTLAPAVPAGKEEFLYVVTG